MQPRGVVLISQISISRLSFRHNNASEDLFNNVSVNLDSSWKLGLVGRNGSGKTTLLRLLCGHYVYSGALVSSIPFSYFPFEIGNEGDRVLDIVGRIAPAAQWRIQRELSLLRVDEEVLYRSFNTLSNGEKVKVQLAGLFVQDHHFPLLDEPTNHLDLEGRAIVGEYLRKKSGYILVSHDRCFLDACVDHILSINRQDIEVMRGNYSTWERNKQERDSCEMAESEKLKKDIAKLQLAAQRVSSWSEQAEKNKKGRQKTEIKGPMVDRGYIGHKAAKMMKRSKAIELRHQRALLEKSALLKNVEVNEPLVLHPLNYHRDCLVEAVNFYVCFSEKAVFAPINFRINRGERVVLCGRNGAGKTSLLRCIAGNGVLPGAGSLHTGGSVKCSFVPQDVTEFSGSLDSYIQGVAVEESLFKAVLRKLNISRRELGRDLADWSMGQRKKVLLAKSLCEKAHLYIWDEPLNYVDVLSRVQLESLIVEFKPTMVFVEHDARFTDTVATRRMFIEGTGRGHR